MLSRTNSNASSRPRKTKSFSPLRTRSNESTDVGRVDPIRTRIQAITAANLAFDRAMHGVDANGDSKRLETRRPEGNTLKKSRSVRFVGPTGLLNDKGITRTEVRELRSTQSSSSLRPSRMRHKPSDAASRRRSRSSITALPPVENPTLRVATWNRLKRTKSLFMMVREDRSTPLTYASTRLSSSADRVNLVSAYPFHVDSASPPLERAVSRIFKDYSYQDASIELARQNYHNSVAEQQEKTRRPPATLTKHRRSPKSFKYTVRTRTTKPTAMDDTPDPHPAENSPKRGKIVTTARKISVGFKKSIGRVFLRRTNESLPRQYVQAGRDHFQREINNRYSPSPIDLVPDPGNLSDSLNSRGEASISVTTRRNRPRHANVSEVFADLDNANIDSRVTSLTSWDNSTPDNTLRGRKSSNKIRLSLVPEESPGNSQSLPRNCLNFPSTEHYPGASSSSRSRKYRPFHEPPRGELDLNNRAAHAQGVFIALRERIGAAGDTHGDDLSGYTTAQGLVTAREGKVGAQQRKASAGTITSGLRHYNSFYDDDVEPGLKEKPSIRKISSKSSRSQMKYQNKYRFDADEVESQLSARAEVENANGDSPNGSYEEMGEKIARENEAFRLNQKGGRAKDSPQASRREIPAGLFGSTQVISTPAINPFKADQGLDALERSIRAVRSGSIDLGKRLQCEDRQLQPKVTVSQSPDSIYSQYTDVSHNFPAACSRNAEATGVAYIHQPSPFLTSPEEMKRGKERRKVSREPVEGAAKSEFDEKIERALAKFGNHFREEAQFDGLDTDIGAARASISLVPVQPLAHFDFNAAKFRSPTREPPLSEQSKENNPLRYPVIRSARPTDAQKKGIRKRSQTIARDLTSIDHAPGYTVDTPVPESTIFPRNSDISATALAIHTKRVLNRARSVTPVFSPLSEIGAPSRNKSRTSDSPIDWANKAQRSSRQEDLRPMNEIIKDLRYSSVTKEKSPSNDENVRFASVPRGQAVRGESPVTYPQQSILGLSERNDSAQNTSLASTRLAPMADLLHKMAHEVNASQPDVKMTETGPLHNLAGPLDRRQSPERSRKLRRGQPPVNHPVVRDISVEFNPRPEKNSVIRKSPEIKYTNDNDSDEDLLHRSGFFDKYASFDPLYVGRPTLGDLHDSSTRTAGHSGGYNQDIPSFDSVDHGDDDDLDTILL